MKILKKIKKAATAITAVLIIALVCVALITSLVNRKNGRPTFIFGYSMLYVETGSMEPAIPEKSYILTKKYDGAVDIGDVITFVCSDASSEVYGKLITHRVIEITESGYKTNGDNSMPDTWTVRSDDIVATHIKNLPVMTFFGRVFASPIGLVLIIAMFLGSCVFLYIPDITAALRDEDKIKAEKEKMIEERVREEVRRMQEKDKNEVDK